MKSGVFLKDFLSEREQIHRYLYHKMLVYGSWNCFSFHFLPVVNYKCVNWEPFSADWLGKQILKTCRVQSTSQVAENRRV